MNKASSSSTYLILATLSGLAALGGIYGTLATHRGLNARKEIVQTSMKSFQSGESSRKISPDLAALLVKDSQIQIEFLGGIQEVNSGLMIASGVNTLTSLAFGLLYVQARRRNRAGQI